METEPGRILEILDDQEETTRAVAARTEAADTMKPMMQATMIASQYIALLASETEKDAMTRIETTARGVVLGLGLMMTNMIEEDLLTVLLDVMIAGNANANDDQTEIATATVTTVAATAVTVTVTTGTDDPLTDVVVTENQETRDETKTAGKVGERRVRRQGQLIPYSLSRTFLADLKLYRMTEEEHEARSVFVTQLAARIGDRELFHFMEQNVGKVRDARVILDRVSRRSKG